MKIEELFREFLKQEMIQGSLNDYYNRIIYVNITKGKNNKNYYEIFMDNADNYSLGFTKEEVLIESFCDYLEENNIDYDTEEIFNNIIEYINVYDSKELIEDIFKEG